jgi:hypothetical protein
LLALRSYHDVDIHQKREMLALQKYIEDAEESVLRDAREEIDIYETNGMRDCQVSIAKNGADFQIGQRVMRAGLSSYGMDVIRWLQKGEDLPKLALIMKHLQKGVGDVRSKLEGAKDVFIRPDGVFTEFIQ